MSISSLNRSTGPFLWLRNGAAVLIGSAWRRPPSLPWLETVGLFWVWVWPSAGGLADGLCPEPHELCLWPFHPWGCTTSTACRSHFTHRASSMAASCWSISWCLNWSWCWFLVLFTFSPPKTRSNRHHKNKSEQVFLHLQSFFLNVVLFIHFSGTAALELLVYAIINSLPLCATLGTGATRALLLNVCFFLFQNSSL